ncbi:prostaglandin reductase 1 isoform X2 [Danio rerio]|uniref:Prostaglandin reductase 1 n=1 Tax=Danio rerio TaxID=7955 RepID=A0A1D5NSP9_DANRE|nr:prostaglandin reductase 1-like isoform X2 [Danio rerio]|eukprot:XP_695372.2 prostaglandin reductase 1-like isoform X2 [Danio rerio]
MVKAKVWILKKHFEGFPKESNFELKEVDLPELQDGDVLVEAIYFSLDPYMRSLSKMFLKEGDVQYGTQLAKVLKSKDPEFPEGCYVVADCGWRTHTVTKAKGPRGPILTRIVSEWPTDIPMSLALGSLGMPGLTALYGLEEVCKIQPGQTVLVSAAAGTVGTVVGQICKIKGCKVVGSAGGDDKVAYLKELGFDQAFNYKTVPSLEEALKNASPEGYDCYFESVGGPMFTAALKNMKPGGRIAVCGAIATYNDTTPQMCPYPHHEIIVRSLTIQGFMVTNYKEKDEESVKRLLTWMKEGKLKTKEMVTVGFDKLPIAFMKMLKGDGLGKAIVKV